MTVARLPIDRHYDKRIRAWLLALLRYAITLDDEDRLVALAAAAEIDKPGTRRSGDFRFFHRTSAELCQAMANPDRSNADVLRCHLDRMSDPRMKRAFAAALELNHPMTEPAPRTPKGLERNDLWKGLKGPPAINRLRNKA